MKRKKAASPFKPGTNHGPIAVLKDGSLAPPAGTSFLTCAKCNYYAWLLLTSYGDGPRPIEIMVCGNCGETRQVVAVPDDTKPIMN